MSNPRPLPTRERGRTTIADRVVEKIAAAAAVEVGNADGLQRRVAGRGVGARRARVSAAVDGSVASLQLDLAVHYPASIRHVTRNVRTRVTEQVGRQCGMTVDHVDITVAVLPRAHDRHRRVQ